MFNVFTDGHAKVTEEIKNILSPKYIVEWLETVGTDHRRTRVVYTPGNPDKLHYEEQFYQEETNELVWVEQPLSGPQCYDLVCRVIETLNVSTRNYSKAYNDLKDHALKMWRGIKKFCSLNDSYYTLLSDPAHEFEKDFAQDCLVFTTDQLRKERE